MSTQPVTFKQVPPGGPRLRYQSKTRVERKNRVEALVDAHGLQAQLCCLDGTWRFFALKHCAKIDFNVFTKKNKQMKLLSNVVLSSFPHCRRISGQNVTGSFASDRYKYKSSDLLRFETETFNGGFENLNGTIQPAGPFPHVKTLNLETALPPRRFQKQDRHRI